MATEMYALNAVSKKRLIVFCTVDYFSLYVLLCFSMVFINKNEVKNRKIMC